MILRGAKAVALLALGALAPASAHADVLEVGPDGAAHWVTGSPDLRDQSIVEAVKVPAGTPIVGESRASLAALTVPPAYAAKVHELSARFDLSPALIEALVWQESRWRARAVSPAGARGLAQLMPGTARELGVDPDDPFANLEGGARYLRQQLDRFDG